MDREIIYMMEELLEDSMAYSAVNSLAGLVCYVFCSISLYTIAQRREIRHPWMAWVPVLNLWILGSISDQYRYVVKGQVKSRRKVLLVLRGIVFVLGLVFMAHLVYTLISFFGRMGYGGWGELEQLLGSLGLLLVILLPMLVLSVLSAVLEYMALYDLYTSCDPDNHVIYLVLSILPGINLVTTPLFLFLCRNLDKGMPPRRETAEEI